MERGGANKSGFVNTHTKKKNKGAFEGAKGTIQHRSAIENVYSRDHCRFLHLHTRIYTGAINQILLLSYFAWPSCGYLANKQVITGSYFKHILDHYDTALANQRASRYYA